MPPPEPETLALDDGVPIPGGEGGVSEGVEQATLGTLRSRAELHRAVSPHG